MSRVVIALLLLISTLAGATGPAIATTTSDRALHQTTTLHLTPERPGEVSVTVAYDVPSAVTGVESRLPANATVTTTDGFAREGNGLYRWQETTRQPSITFQLQVNETSAGKIPLAGEGEYVFVDVGEWALFRRPSVGTRWEWRGDEVKLAQSTTAAGEGVVGDQLVFLGGYTEHRRTANGQQFRLVVPEAATLAETPDAILGAYADAAGRLRVGDRDDSVLVIAAPTDRVAWGVRGLGTGDSDIWVRDSEPLSTPNNVWLHEYIHSRQSYRPATEMQWFTEASATYYAALFTLEQGHISYEEFETWLAIGEREPYASAVLDDPTTWGQLGNYHKGALVAGYLDYRLRADGDASLDAIFEAMNREDGVVGNREFRRYVAASGNVDIRADADRYVGTRAVPAVWNRSEHVAVFGPFPAHVRTEFGVNASNPAVVTGPYRNVSVETPAGTTLVTNETLRLPVVVMNDGGRAGTYDIALRVGGKVETRVTGRLDAGETAVEPVTHTFDTPGTYTVSVGDETYTVFVRDPAQATVRDVTATPPRVGADEEVTVSATVSNGASLPGRTTVAFTVDDAVVDRRTVTLAARSETTVATTVTLSEPGAYRVGVEGEMPVTVTVVDDETETARATPTATVEETTTTTTPGFGPVATLVALLTVVSLLGLGWLGGLGVDARER